ncbi:MAG: hypothetical protein WBA29_17050 [Xanthobacteraceae bacterium]
MALAPAIDEIRVDAEVPRCRENIHISRRTARTRHAANTKDSIKGCRSINAPGAIGFQWNQNPVPRLI